MQAISDRKIKKMFNLIEVYLNYLYQKMQLLFETIKIEFNNKHQE